MDCRINHDYTTTNSHELIPPTLNHSVTGARQVLNQAVYIYIYIHIYIYTYIHTYIHTYLHTYLLTYIHTIPYHTIPYLTLPYVTLPYLTLPYLTLHYITYTHTCENNEYINMHKPYMYIEIHVNTYKYIYIQVLSL